MDDLARASPEDLAKRLLVYQRITQRWVESAKETREIKG